MAASHENVRRLTVAPGPVECTVTGDRDCARVLRRLADQIEKGAVHAKRLSARQTGSSRGFAMFELEIETSASEEARKWL